MSELTIYRSRVHRMIDDLEEAIIMHGLSYSTTSLRGLISRQEAIEDVIRDVDDALRLAGRSRHEHIRPIYSAVSRSGAVVRDWRLSRLAFFLFILKCRSTSPELARLQIRILSELPKG